MKGTLKKRCQQLSKRFRGEDRGGSSDEFWGEAPWMEHFSRETMEDVCKIKSLVVSKL